MLIVVVFSGFVLALFTPRLVRVFRAQANWIIAALPAALCLYFLAQIPAMAAGQALRATWDWAPSLDISLAFKLDGLAALFGLLISGIGSLVAVYAGDYLGGRDDLGRFYVYHLLFMASMLGVVLADNLIVLFVFWELTSVTSYLLIGFDHGRAEARAGALKALLITGGGGLAMLAGFILLGQSPGGYDLSALLEQAQALGNGARVVPAEFYLPVLTLILLGAFTKSAQAPFHIWLPDAMQAPTPVSAYLHSATMVKAGVYLLARLIPLLGGSPAWFYAVSGVGLATALAGGLIALKQTDMKAILAYTTISWLGALVMLLGWGGHLAVEAALVGVLAHALYKGALFLLVGGIDHATGTRDIRALSGLRRTMPFSAGLMGLAAGSMAGLPLCLGFIAKELLLEATLHGGYPPALAALAAAAALIASMLNGAMAWRLFHGVFFGRPAWPSGANAPGASTPGASTPGANTPGANTPGANTQVRPYSPPHDPAPAMLLGPAVLGGLSLLLGVAPSVAGPLTTAAVSSVLNEPVEAKLALWHGFTPVLGLSLLAIAAGLGVYLGYARAAGGVERLLRFSFNAAYDRSLAGLYDLACALTGLVQNGRFRFYLMTIMGSSMALVGYVLLTRAWFELDWLNVRFNPPRPIEVLLSGVIVVTAVMVTQARHRLAAIAGMSVIGALVSLFFVLFSAPDLAVTQLVIETLMVIVFLLVFHFLPPFFEGHTPRLARWRDVGISAVIGLVAAGLVLFATGAHFEGAGVAQYFIEHSQQAHGHNVVNVILVDFRGFDTLGEISVLTIAATGIYALLMSKRESPRLLDNDQAET